ncbi:RNA polymerase sigma-70 factor (ECF subfamily) [Chryseomicrobium aureum]|uniref:sigma-70 family RNA polymerase sigma factor n=1 Tax=Chryseomicrobium aureum TaxID=1441723 RepID=UPI00195827BA|nr:sigma-70 family RNA polymerase sigma factor [Chryseomicrobium aureum]MBM7706844.1 RNA polymerase sigma-70 factor (ECF subfamily) [Chryseomicrobium aureum]
MEELRQTKEATHQQHLWHDDLMDTYGLEMTKLAYTYVKNWSTAQDVVQDVFVKAYHYYSKREKLHSVRGWLIRLTINQSKDYLKSSWFRRVTGLDSKHSTETTQSAEDMLTTSSSNAQLSQAVLALKQGYREVIFLYYYEELTVREMSEVLKVKEATLHTRLRRAKMELHHQLKGEDFVWGTN